jgi:hypothetical protein
MVCYRKFIEPSAGSPDDNIDRHHPTANRPFTLAVSITHFWKEPCIGR